MGGPACLVALCLSGDQHLPFKLLRLLQIMQPSEVAAGADQCHVCSMQNGMRELSKR